MIETSEKPDRTRLSIEPVKKQTENKCCKINGLKNATEKTRSVCKHRRAMEQKNQHVIFARAELLISRISQVPGRQKMAPPAGLEPATYGLTVRRSTD